METAPETAPVEPLETTPVDNKKTGLPRVQFTHRGRRKTMFKLKPDQGAPWYIHFEVGKERHKKCLDTNIQRTAMERARRHIDDVVEGKWQRHDRKPPSKTLKEAVDVYNLKAPVYQATKTKNVWALKFILKTCGLPTDLESVRLTDIDGSMNSMFQNQMIDQYVSKAVGESEKREARELALRTSRSLLGQARSIFTKKGHLREDYAEAGIKLPPSIDAFITARRQGRQSKRQYLAPPDEVVKEAFTAIEKLRDEDLEAYKVFWFAVGAGLRRGEIRRMRWSHVVERDGRLWVSGGIGKDGEIIDVPIQKVASDKLLPLRQAAKVKAVRGGDKPALRLNRWMAGHGWKTEKKMHELRAYIGSLLYQVSPLAAMRFMRHKSIKVTETFYVRYGAEAKPVDVL